jgi:hypothetical protein
LKALLALINEEHQLMSAHVSKKRRVLPATQWETEREMNGWTEIESRCARIKNLAASASLLGAQEKIETEIAMVSVSLACVILTAKNKDQQGQCQEIFDI